MYILTFDTSLDKTYVSLSKDGKMVSSEIIENHNEKYHSAFLMPTIVSILKSNNIKMQDIGAIGTNVGPGSFTGIRACVTVARVFAQQLNIPLVGVSSLEILSYLNTSTKPSLLVLDARKKQFYTAIYQNGVELSKPSLTNFDDLMKIDFSKYFVVSDEASSKILGEKGVESVVFSKEKFDFGSILNQITFSKIDKSESDYHWAKLKPLYLQAPPVSMPSK